MPEDGRGGTGVVAVVGTRDVAAGADAHDLRQVAGGAIGVDVGDARGGAAGLAEDAAWPAPVVVVGDAGEGAGQAVDGVQGGAGGAGPAQAVVALGAVVVFGDGAAVAAGGAAAAGAGFDELAAGLIGGTGGNVGTAVVDPVAVEVGFDAADHAVEQVEGHVVCFGPGLGAGVAAAQAAAAVGGDGADLLPGQAAGVDAVDDVAQVGVDQVGLVAQGVVEDLGDVAVAVGDGSEVAPGVARIGGEVAQRILHLGDLAQRVAVAHHGLRLGVGHLGGHALVGGQRGERVADFVGFDGLDDAVEFVVDLLVVQVGLAAVVERLVGVVEPAVGVIRAVAVDFAGGAGVSRGTAPRLRNGPALQGRDSLQPLLQLLLCGVRGWPIGVADSMAVRCDAPKLNGLTPPA